MSDLYIDAGLTQKEGEALVGTFVVPREPFRALLGRRVSSKALDDRAGFVTLLRAAELLRDTPLDVDLYLMGSSREETNGGGAVVGAFLLRPTVLSPWMSPTPVPPILSRKKLFPLAGEQSLASAPNMTRWMTDRLITKAEAQGIPWSPEVMTGHSGTNAWRVQVAREGIATAVVSLPLKYMHSPVETLDLDDLEHSAALLAAFVQDLAREGGEFLAD